MKENRKVALITAAGGGIGGACARILAGQGYDLVLMTRSDAAEQLAAELGGIGFRGSVTETADLERMVDGAMSRFGRIDAIVNNTGHAPNTGIPGTGVQYEPDIELNLASLDDDAWQSAFELIFLNVVRLTRLTADIMAKQGRGSIVNITSFAQKEPSVSYPTGSCMRMALAGFTKLFADSHAAKNVRMNNVLPGFIENFEFEDRIRRQVPMARPGTLEEVANTVAFLLSDAAGYVTGQSILVDGGLNRGV